MPGLRHEYRKQHKDEVINNARDQVDFRPKEKRANKDNQHQGENAWPDATVPKRDGYGAEGERHNREGQMEVEKRARRKESQRVPLPRVLPRTAALAGP